MSEHPTVPDLLFDADRTHDEAPEVVRDDWVIVDGVSVFEVRRASNPSPGRRLDDAA